MSIFERLQRKGSAGSVRTSSASSFLQSSRSFTTTAIPHYKQVSSDQQTRSTYGAGVHHSLARIPISLAEGENHTGISDNLKAGIENLSGISMHDVRVHYNSAKPARIQALAYTQGVNIHLGPGQEKHLPHEVWHVVQQKQGRVQPTMQTSEGAMNDDPGLEREATVMGLRATGSGTIAESVRLLASPPSQGIIQGVFKVVRTTFSSEQDVENARQKILTDIPKHSSASGDEVVALLKDWAKAHESKGYYGSYKALGKAGLSALRIEQAKSLPSLMPIKVKTGPAKNYKANKLARAEKVEKLRGLHRAASLESVNEAAVTAHRDVGKMVSLKHKGEKKSFKVGFTTNFLVGGTRESDYKQLFAQAKALSGLNDSQLAARLINGLHGETGYLDGLKDDAKKYIIKIIALIQGPEFRRSAVNPVAATAALNKVISDNSDIYQTLLENALFTVSEKVVEPGGSLRSQFHRADFPHNENFLQAAEKQYDTILKLADANGVDVEDEKAVETFVGQTTKSTMQGLLSEFDLT